MDSRKRPFTEFERSFIINLIQQNAIVDNKKIDGATIQKKNAAWAKITEEYNASTRITQKIDMKQMKKFWNNFKLKSKDKTKENQTNFTISPALPEDAETKIFNTLTNVTPTIKIEEHDLNENNKCDDDDSYWTHLNTDDVALPTECEVTASSEDIVSDTPEITEFDEPKPRRVVPSVDQHSVKSLKTKIMEQEHRNRAIRFKTEMEHKKRLQEYEIKLKEQELEHKARLYSLYEEEMKVKINMLKSKKCCD